MARASTAPLGFRHGEVARKIGGFVGSGNYKQILMEYKVEIWVAGVKRLAVLARELP